MKKSIFDIFINYEKTALQIFFFTYKLNLNWHIEFFFTCTWFSFSPPTFNSYCQDVLVKLRRIAVYLIVVFLFRCYTSEKFQEAISRSRTWRFLVHCLSLKYVVSDHFWWGNIPVNQKKKTNKNKYVFTLIKFAHGTGLLSIWGIWKLFQPVK